MWVMIILLATCLILISMVAVLSSLRNKTARSEEEDRLEEDGDCYVLLRE